MVELARTYDFQQPDLGQIDAQSLIWGRGAVRREKPGGDAKWQRVSAISCFRVDMELKGYAGVTHKVLDCAQDGAECGRLRAEGSALGVASGAGNQKCRLDRQTRKRLKHTGGIAATRRGVDTKANICSHGGYATEDTQQKMLGVDPASCLYKRT